MLSYTFLPHITAFTIDVKLSSVRIISEASLATSVPAIPCKRKPFICYKIYTNIITNYSYLTIAKPTSAFLRAGPSLVPSPVTATTSRLGFNRESIIPFTRTYLS